jgi:hypothetical protein
MRLLTRRAGQAPAYRGVEALVPRVLAYVLLALTVAFAFNFLQHRLSYQRLAVVMGAISLGSILLAISFRWPQVIVLGWLLTLLGIREAIYVPTPGLPDLTLDRLAMLWILAVFAIKSIMERRPLKGPLTVDILLLIHLAYLFGSILYHESRSTNSWSKAYLMPYVAFFMAQQLMGDVRWIKRALGLLLVLSIYNGFTSIAEHFHWTALVWPKYILDSHVGTWAPGRSRGIFLQMAVLGTVMGMILGVHFYFLRMARTVIARVAVIGTIGISILGNYFTYTRGNYLAAIMGLLALLYFGFRAYASWLFRMGLLAVVVLGLGAAQFVQRDAFMQERIGYEGTVTGRLNKVVTAFRIWRDHPIFGIGYGKYQEVKHQYKQAVEVPFFGVIRGQQGFESSLHDIYWGVLSEEGIVGMLLQLTIWGLILKTLWKKFKWRKRGDYFAIYILPVIACIFAAYWAGGVAFDYRYFAAMGGLFYFAAGILYGYGEGEEREADRPESGEGMILSAG